MSEDIREITPELRQLAADMVETMYARDGIGLAAPQVGQAVRLVVMDVSGPDKREDLRILVNPKLILSGDEIESEEGCLSVGDFRSAVCRREHARITAVDLDGNPVKLDADGLLAVCAQHECDHLDGVLFIDHISRLKRSLYDRKIRKKGR